MQYVEVSSHGIRYVVVRRDADVMPYTRTFGPLTSSLREEKFSRQFESLLQQGRIFSPSVSFPVSDFAQISVYCLLEVLPKN